MKRTLSLCLFTLTFALASQAGILTLTAPGGVVSGAPGTTVGWDFSIAGDSQYWTVITAVQLGTDPSPVGTSADFTDLISPSSFYLLAPNMTLTNMTAGMQLATFFIPGNVAVGQNSPPLSILLDYDLYDGDPNVAGQQVGFSHVDSAAAQIDVVAPQMGGSSTPEPGTWMLLLSAIPGFACRRLRFGKRAA